MLSQHINKINGCHAVKRAKKAVTLERSLFREICELKILAKNLFSVIKVLYKGLMEPENGGHTHTHTHTHTHIHKVSTVTLVRMRAER